MSSSSTTTDLHRSSSQVVIIITMVTVILGSAGGENVLQRLSRLERFSEVRLSDTECYLCSTPTL